MPDYNKINLSNVKFEGDPFDVNEGVMPEEAPEPTFDPTTLSTSSVTPTDDDEIITGENGSWVRKTFAKLKEYFARTFTITEGDNNGQIKVSPDGGTAYNVNIKGLKSAAYLDADTAATANKVVQRNANGYIYGTYINQSSGEESSATNARPCIIDGSGWNRKFSISAFKSLLGLGNIGEKTNISTSTPTANLGVYSTLGSVNLAAGTWLIYASCNFVPTSNTGTSSYCFNIQILQGSTVLGEASDGGHGTDNTTPSVISCCACVQPSSTTTYTIKAVPWGVGAKLSARCWALRIL